MKPTPIKMVGKKTVEDRKQRQQLAKKKAQGKEKPFKECKECLYIMDNCVLCDNADMFFDGMEIEPDVVSLMVVDTNTKGVVSSRVNRVTTQLRDGCVF